MRVNQPDTNGHAVCNVTRPRRIALIFDDQARPETTGVYCRRAIGALAEVAFFHPSRLAEVPRTGFDLYLNIDDGMRYLWPGELRPCAWWAIDTHLDFSIGSFRETLGACLKSAAARADSAKP